MRFYPGSRRDAPQRLRMGSFQLGMATQRYRVAAGFEKVQHLYNTPAGLTREACCSQSSPLRAEATVRCAGLQRAQEAPRQETELLFFANSFAENGARRAVLRAPPIALWRASAGWGTAHDGCMRRAVLVRGLAGVHAGGRIHVPGTCTGTCTSTSTRTEPVPCKSRGQEGFMLRGGAPVYGLSNMAAGWT
jgi:hypothetical protein